MTSVHICEKSVPGNSNCKGPETRVCLGSSQNGTGEGRALMELR